MAPPKKKRRVAPASGNTETTNMDIAEDPSSSNLEELISRKDLLKKELIGHIDALNNGESNDSEANSGAANGASISFLRLKSLQRGILEKVRKTQALLRQQALVRDKQELQLENLRYQHALNLKSQRESNRAIELTSLDIARLVRNQTSKDEAKEEKEGSTGEDDKVLLEKFLGGDWKDPSKRESIMSKLNMEVATRKNLEDELNRLKDDRKKKQESLASREKLLRDLPSKLADMERASLPLQKFYQKQSSASPSLMKATPKLGNTKRRSRLDLAKTLPKALYTLFHQLQSCLDVIETNQGDPEISDITPDSLPTVEVQKEAVLLNIPIPTISAGGEMSYRPKKQVSIVFRYDAALDFVLAVCGTDYDMGLGVIDELFPGDRGEFLGTEDSKPSTSGRAYQWCNYLGGLHVSPSELTAAKKHCSAKVIVRALVRKVRATATLSWILHSFSRKPNAPNFPRHAAMMDEDEENAEETMSRLSSWTALKTDPEIMNGGGHKGNQLNRSYKAVLQHGSGKATKKVTAIVSINMARYPSSVPRWKILQTSTDEEEASLDALQSYNGGEPSQQLPLFNEALARLEQTVNRKVDELVIPSDQTTYEWILAEQLYRIARGWEDSFQENA